MVHEAVQSLLHQKNINDSKAVKHMEIKSCLSNTDRQGIGIEVFWVRTRVGKRTRKEVNLKRKMKAFWLFFKQSATNLMPSRNVSIKIKMRLMM